MQLGGALQGQQLRSARQLHRPCLRPAAATGIASNRRAASSAAACAGSSSDARLHAAGVPHGVATLHQQQQQQQQQQQRRRHVVAGASSLSLPDPSGDGSSSSSSSSQARGPTPIVSDAGNTMDPQVVASWLREYLPFKLLSESSVALLAELMEVEFVPANKLLAREGSTPAELVVVRQGSIRVSGENMPVPLDAGPGASCFLIELLLGQPTTSTVRTSSDCVLWVVRGPALMALAARRPDLVLELGLKMSQDLAQQVEAMEANMQ
eukprot:jgi/Sobl393_1/11042/SZX62060.1